MRYLSVCSGIEAASQAWHHLGWKPVAFSEIEPFPSQVLAYHYPDVPNAGDFTKIEGHEYGNIDLLVGGTPCQAFSVAGKRAGLDDPRGNLTIEYARLAGRTRPKWLVWENVPGVLSIDGGRTFGAFLGMLEELGYGVAWRVLDAQNFGVPQRRRRVFVVGYLGDRRRAAAVLLEWESLLGDTKKGGKARKNTAGSAGTSPASGGGRGTSTNSGGSVGVDITPALTNRGNGFARIGDRRGQDPVVAVEKGCWWDGGQTSQTLDAVLYKGQTMPEKNRFPAVLVPDEQVHAADMRHMTIDPEATIALQAGGDGINVNCIPSVLIPAAEPVAMRESGPGYWMEDDKAGTLRAEGENRPSRPSTVVAVDAGAFNNTGNGYWTDADAAAPVRCGGKNGGGGARESTVLAFGCKDSSPVATEDISPTLRSMGFDKSHANAGGQVAVAFVQNTRDEVRLFGGDGQTVGALAAEPGMKQTCYVAIDKQLVSPTSPCCGTGLEFKFNNGTRAWICQNCRTIVAEGAGAHKSRLDKSNPAIAFRTNQTGAAGPIHSEELTDTLAQDHPPAVAYSIQAGAVRENPESGPDGVGVREDDTAYTLEARAEVQAVAFDTTQLTSPKNYSNPQLGDPCHPLASGAHPPAIATFQASDYKTGAFEEVEQSRPLTTSADRSRSAPVVFESRFVRNGRGAPSELVPPLKAQSGLSGKGDAAPLVLYEKTEPIDPFTFQSNAGRDFTCDTDVSAPIRVGSTVGIPSPPAVVYSIMPMNSGKDYKAREVEVVQPLMAGGPVGGNQGGDYVVQLTQPQPLAFRTSGYGASVDDTASAMLASDDRISNQIYGVLEPTVTHSLRADGFDASEDGTGRGTPLVPVAFQDSQSGTRLVGTHATLDSNNGPRRRNGVLTEQIKERPSYASQAEANAHQILRLLQLEVGTQATAEWRLGVLVSLQSKEVLQPGVHGEGVRCGADEGRRRLDDGTLPRTESGQAEPVPEVQQETGAGRTPQRWRLSEQLTRELSALMPQLSHEGTPAVQVLQHMWREGEGFGVLQQALPAIQGRPAGSTMAVRRLTPRECERLQGFFDDWTLVPTKKVKKAGADCVQIDGEWWKLAADGPRYKALGNSMAVPCMRWIGERIAWVEELIREEEAANGMEDSTVRAAAYMAETAARNPNSGMGDTHLSVTHIQTVAAEEALIAERIECEECEMPLPEDFEEDSDVPEPEDNDEFPEDFDGCDVDPENFVE